MTRPPAPMAIHHPDQLFAEVAYIAYHFHWGMDDILDLEHPLRQRFVTEISRLNDRANEGG